METQEDITKGNGKKLNKEKFRLYLRKDVIDEEIYYTSQGEMMEVSLLWSFKTRADKQRKNIP